jgi:hypothetical protein
MLAVTNTMNGAGFNITFTPAAKLDPQSPLINIRLPRCVLISEAEQMVSTLRHGPVYPNVYDSLPHATLRDPVSEVYGVTGALNLPSTEPYSAELMPTTTLRSHPETEAVLSPPCNSRVYADVIRSLWKGSVCIASFCERPNI